MQNEDIPSALDSPKGMIHANQTPPPVSVPSSSKKWQCRIGYYTIPTNDAENSVKMYEKLFAYVQQPAATKKNAQEAANAKAIAAAAAGVIPGRAKPSKKAGPESAANNVNFIKSYLKS